MYSRRQNSTQCGHALIELLLSIPVMFLIVLGGADVVTNINDLQTAQAIARATANDARRSCLRFDPTVHLDALCMERLFHSVAGTLTNTRMIVSVYGINEDNDPELLDAVASYEDFEITDSRMTPEKLFGDYRMVQHAVYLRENEESLSELIDEEFVVAVSEIFFEHDYLSTFRFSSPNGYQLAVF